MVISQYDSYGVYINSKKKDNVVTFVAEMVFNTCKILYEVCNAVMVMKVGLQRIVTILTAFDMQS